VKEVARKIRGSNPDQKLILLANDEKSDNTNENLESLFDASLRKPFTISELIEIIEKISSPLRSKGSRIFSKPEEIEDLLGDIFADCEEKICSVNPLLISHGTWMPGRVPTYYSTLTKGLKVFIVVEISEENLLSCKKLTLNRSVQLRHLKGVQPSFSIWDERHLTERLLSQSSSIHTGHVLYSNSEYDVKRAQYLFDYFWSISEPADRRINELESLSTTDLSLISGMDNIVHTLSNVIRNAQTYVDTCVSRDWMPNLVKTEILSAKLETVSREVHNRILVEITKENLWYCEKLVEIGVEIRHLPALSAEFTLNDNEIVLLASTEELISGQASQAVYSKIPSFVTKQKSMFDALWNTAIPASTRIRELEEKGLRLVN
jgi:hypothetical protein